MAKTYNTFTNVSTGDVLTATNFNNVLTNVGNYRVPPSAKARRPSAQSIANTTMTFVTFTSEDWDTDGMFSASDTKITINTAGIYLVTAGIFWASNNNGLRITTLEKNAATASNGTKLQRVIQTPTQNDATILSVSGVYSFVAGDTVHMTLYQSAGGALNAGAADDDSLSLAVHWLGQVS